MATTPGARLIRPLLRGLGCFAAALALAVVAYLLAGWIGSSVPRNGDWREPARGDVVIGVETNGVHTALVLPLVTPGKDWRRDFPITDIKRPDRPYTHVSISWGERAIFLDTPTWWDLSPRTVLRIATVGGEGLAHIGYYVRPATSSDLRPIRLRAMEYRRLVAAIEAGLRVQRPLVAHPGYGATDVFYDAGGTYTVLNTCNQWTSDRLAEAGVRTGWWTPMQGGVMKWASRPEGPRGLALPSFSPARGAVAGPAVGL